MPVSCELTAANAADALSVGELLAEARLGGQTARGLPGGLAYRSGGLREDLLAGRGVLLAR